MSRSWWAASTSSLPDSFRYGKRQFNRIHCTNQSFFAPLEFLPTKSNYYFKFAFTFLRNLNTRRADTDTPILRILHRVVMFVSSRGDLILIIVIFLTFFHY